jgi:hypothetical protein
MEFAIRKRNWNAVEALLPLRGKIRIPPDDRDGFEKELWNDLCSEYDSLHFYRHALSSRLEPSLEFREFLDAWRDDESNHAEGFLHLYLECFSADAAGIRRRLEARASDFSKLSWFFEDEFRLCLLIAYDERATTVSYHLDRTFYRELGGPVLENWIARVRADEALHLANLVNLIRYRHHARIPEARKVMERIVELDVDQSSYAGTFVLDHTGSPFNPEMLRGCADRIINKLENIS